MHASFGSREFSPEKIGKKRKPVKPDISEKRLFVLCAYVHRDACLALEEQLKNIGLPSSSKLKN
jgi:hypothetical protein